MSNRWLDPKFWTIIFGGIIALVNSYFGWSIDPEKFAATTFIILNYLVTQGIVDIKRTENGVMRYSLNSMKFIAVLFVATIMGFSNLIGLDIPEEWVWSGVIGIFGFLGIKGIQDVKAAKNQGKEVETNGYNKLRYTAEDNE